MTYGLLGRTLKHSYSEIIHHALGNKQYTLTNVERDEFYELFESRTFKACNVTIPYKKDAYNLCDVLSEEAKNIGSVNTVVNKDGVLYGYNTDFAGFVYMIERAGIDLEGKNVIILGTGGTSLTAKAVCKAKNSGKITVVSRTGNVNYENVYDLTETQIVINTTPVGMYPDNCTSAVDISKFPKLCGVVDVIYNPLVTKLMYDAKKLCIPTTGGLSMLVYQAVRAHEIFFDTKICDSVVEQVLSECLMMAANIVLIGMPGCGKTSIGNLIAQKLTRVVLDTDNFIEQSGMTIPQIFERFGEAQFRSRETEALKILSSMSGKVISTGGGAVIKEENVRFMRQNGIVVYIKRQLEKLSADNRPLSKGGLEKIKELYEQRKELYENACHFSVDTNENITACAEEIIELVKQNIIKLV